MQPTGTDAPGRARRALLAARAACSITLLLLPAAGAWAQTATVRGFVTDRTDGQPMEGASVVLSAPGREAAGTATNRDGLYLVPRLEPGRYAFTVSFVGYRTHADTLELEAGEVLTANVALVPETIEGGEVVVQTERTEGAARNSAGLQTIRPADIERVPAPDVSGDLAAYLATQPGIVSTGDRGGQLFIRGGEPSQNIVLFDGMVVYQPFHILGFYSAFPSDVLSRADLYAGGFGGRYGGGISSVIDVTARNGNDRRFAGSVALSPFISAARVEGPIAPGRASFILSARRSMIEQGARHLVDEPLPFSFGDVFGKVNFGLADNQRLSLSVLSTYDRGRLAEPEEGTPPDELRWRNLAVGTRYLILPRVLPVSADVRVSHSRLYSAVGPEAEPTRVSRIENTQVSLDATFFGERMDVDAGWSVHGVRLDSELGGLFQNLEVASGGFASLSMYLEPELRLGDGLRLRPSARIQFYNVRLDPYFEPRLRVVWRLGPHELSGAAGVYQQEIVGLSDRRDAASVFTAWRYVTRREARHEDVLEGRLPRALHAILGYRASPTGWLDLSVEGFYRRMRNLFISEWTAYPRFSTRLQPANGRSFGFDTRAEIRRPPFYGFVNYGLASTEYEAVQAAIEIWYGVERLRFRPGHDRRHQVNALASVTLWGFDLSVRWEFGSGLPFNRALGFDGFALIDDVVNASRIPASRRVIYERPYNGRLPTYHRLDASLERTFRGKRADLTLQASVINAYDRRNLLYLDVFTLRRQDQLPLIPSAGLKVEIR